MIPKNEIDLKAEEFDIHPSNVQRDYVFSWILFGIYNLSDLGKVFVLKGGNCLRKAYFKNTRFSSDLDFSIERGITEEYLGRELNQICMKLQEFTGILFEIEKNRFQEKKRVDQSLKVLEARIYFKDFYGEEGKITISVRIDITQFDRIYLPVQERQIIHQYSDIAKCQVKLRCVKLEEILASKLKCLIQRRHSSDFYDYAYSLIFNEQVVLNKREIASTFLRKTIFQRSPGAAKNLLIGLPFQILKGLWEKYIVCPILAKINFEEAVDRFSSSINEMFMEVGTGYGEHLFFGPELRNPIMEAAHSKTLLKLRYGNRVRMVEPYSLVYKIRSDGLGQEYFYGYDTTGGTSSGPGIKTFVNSKVQGIENTEIEFDPRFEIELSKAGEFSNNTYFSKPFSKRRITIFPTRRRHKSKGPVFIYQCPICEKQFKRKKRNTTLKKHKDPYGNDCYGKRAVFIETIYDY